MGETSGTDSGDFALSGLLLCHETESCLNEKLHEDGDHVTGAGTPRSANDTCCVSVSDDDEEYVLQLVRRETRRVGYEQSETASSCAGCTVSASGSDWLRWARLDAIDWLIHTGTKLGFEHQTVYLGIFYFDLFLSRRSIDEGKSWAIRLLSVACLSIAAKMEECRVMGLTEFQSGDNIFEAKVIHRMELLVLTTLDWRMNLVTPFAYLHYFVSKLSKHKSFPNGFASKVSETLLAISKEISLTDHRPSVVSAAAVLAASDDELTRDGLGTKFSSIPWWVSSHNESVYSCYQIMQEMEQRRLRTPDSAISREKQQSVHSTPADVDESCLASGGGSKRRRLSFDGSDQISPAKKIHPAFGDSH